jgi:hypothetical protein
MSWFSERIPPEVSHQLALGEEAPEEAAQAPQEAPEPEPKAELAERAHARRDDPWTSWAAARSQKAIDLRRSQMAVLSLLSFIGPSTDERIAEEYYKRSDLPKQLPSGLRTRRKELVDAGRVRDTGRVAPLRTGRRGIVWAAVIDDPR